MVRVKTALLCTTALCLLPTIAAADPISAAVAATASAIFSAGGVAATTFSAFGLTLSGAGAVFAHFAVRAGLGYALNSLTQQPRARSAGRTYTLNSLGTAQPHAIIYGTTDVGGVIFYETTTSSNRYLHRCIAFAGHEVQAFEKIYLNGDEVTLDGSGNVTAPAKYAGQVRINIHLGSDTQTADSDLVSEVTEWTTDHRAKGIAYIYVRYDGTGGATAFANGIPTLTARIQGRQALVQYDPTDTRISNPAAILRDYILADFGLAEPESAIEENYFQRAEYLCNELISIFFNNPDGSVTGTFAPKFTAGGSFTLDNTPADILRLITSSMGGVLWYSQGKWGCRAADYVAPEVTFTQDDIIGNVNVTTRNSRRANFNSAQGVYRSIDNMSLETDFVPVSNATYLSEDNGQESVQDLQLLFTPQEYMAQRIARIALNRNRRQTTVTASFNLKALRVTIGDTIKLTVDQFGWVEKIFEVADWRFELDNEMVPQVQLLLREIDSGVFP